MPLKEDKTVIGYSAVHLKQGFLCQGEACIIASTEIAMQKHLKDSTTQAHKFQIKPVNVSNLIKGLDTGVLYALDKNVYERISSTQDSNEVVFETKRTKKNSRFIIIAGRQ